MRVKENPGSWRAHAIKKRDFKHDHSEPVVKFRSSKNTNRWCRGKVGFEHDVNWQIEKDFFGHRYKTGRCSHCRKIMFGRS